MLPVAHRLTDGASFKETTRRGRRSASRTVVLHVRGPEPGGGGPDTDGSVDSGGKSRVGFVVTRAVGGSVVRNRVRRRLRHLMVDRLALLPAGTDVVVRALPAASRAGAADLAADLDRCLRRLGADAPSFSPSVAPSVERTVTGAPA